MLLYRLTPLSSMHPSACHRHLCPPHKATLVYNSVYSQDLNCIQFPETCRTAWYTIPWGPEARVTYLWMASLRAHCLRRQWGLCSSHPSFPVLTLSGTYDHQNPYPGGSVLPRSWFLAIQTEAIPVQSFSFLKSSLTCHVNVSIMFSKSLSRHILHWFQIKPRIRYCRPSYRHLDCPVSMVLIQWKLYCTWRGRVPI